MTIPKIIAIQSSNTPAPVEQEISVTDDKHLVMLEVMKELSRPAAQKNVTAVVLNLSLIHI